MIQQKFTGNLKFGKNDINSNVVFYYRIFVYAIVNLRLESILLILDQQLKDMFW